MANTAYATVAELKAFIDITSDTDDTQLQILLNAAAEAIDRYCRHEKPSGEDDFFVADSTASTALYNGSGRSYQRIDDCMSITLVEVKDSPSDSAYTEWTTSDWIAASGNVDNPNFNRTPYSVLICDPNGDYDRFTSGTYTHRPGFRPDIMIRQGTPTVRITAKWGYATTVPHEIKTATCMFAARWYKRLGAGMSDALASGELGTVLYTKKLDPDIEMILRLGRYIDPVTG